MGNHQSQQAFAHPVLKQPSQLSIIIPALNEQSEISQAIKSTKVIGSESQPEVIVVDGGSKDDTTSVASSHTDVQVLCVPEGGRGKQLNEGVLSRLT